MEDPRCGGLQDVRMWEHDVVLPSYMPLPAGIYPMFLEKRVYQGSKGAVYPLPLIERIADCPVEHTYRGIYLENEYIRVLVLPEIGGRIYAAVDKTNGYDFVYHNHVVKPALVGLAGPWIAGGIEFNWPQHHRPTTFLPVDYSLQEREDGSKTVWVGEIEPMYGMKGMCGITLRPGRSFIEVNVQLYNRTPLPQSFLWWSNLAVQVNDHYQSIFPPDVHFVADHAKRAISDFPQAHGVYYGIDYGPGTDISWWKNIPVPTSYMALDSRYSFLAGYDHARKAGIVHVADPHISPGKKMWTWGSGDFGRKWYEHLTDEDGPYIELMTGVYSDNQPDFAWLQPSETKTFTQYWYPLRQIGGVLNATAYGAVSVRQHDSQIRLGVNTTASFRDAKVTLRAGAHELWHTTTDIAPDIPFSTELRGMDVPPHERLSIVVIAADGSEIVRYQPDAPVERSRPSPAKPAPPPHTIGSVEQLYLTGLHLEQYHHATYEPDSYYREALARDPNDARSNTALGTLLLRRGAFADAADHFRRAIAALTDRNPNPYDGEPLFCLGVTLRFLGRQSEAYDAFYKAAWNGSWQSAAYQALAELASQAGDARQALAHARRSLESGWRNTRARGLAAYLLRSLNQLDEAEALARETCQIDALDFWSRRELALIAVQRGRSQEGEAQHAALRTLMRGRSSAYLDLAEDYACAGLWQEAIAVLFEWTERSGVPSDPMVYYHLGYYTAQVGDQRAALARYRRAAIECPDYCFPNRLASIEVLRHAQHVNPTDARAPYYLGNLLYDRKQYAAAIAEWERARALDANFSIVHRNLGLAYFNVEHDAPKARSSFERALAASPDDARILFELDQLDKRLNVLPTERLACLDARDNLVLQRDDLYLERIALHNQLGQFDRSLSLLAQRKFQPWEGGEGKVLEHYSHALVLRGRRSLAAGRPGDALRDFQAAVNYPSNLGETRHEVLTSEAEAYYYAGLANKALGDNSAAGLAYEHAANDTSSVLSGRYYRGVALRELGREAQAAEQFSSLLAAGEGTLASDGGFDYFATSLPTFLVFVDDLSIRNKIDGHFLRALGYAGHGLREDAAAECETVLALDVNHIDAQVLLSTLTV